MKAPIAVAILSYNHQELTARCVESALKFFSPDRVFLLHNGTDEKKVAWLQKSFPDVRHLVLLLNRGFSGGANALLQNVLTDYEWCLFLTNDTELLHLDEAGVIAQEPGLYALQIVFKKSRRMDSWGGVLKLPEAQLRHVKERLPHHPYFYVPGTAFVVHRIVLNAGGFNELLGSLWEDVLWSLQLSSEGLPVAQDLSQSLVAHLGGKTMHKSSLYTLYLFQRNRWLVSFGLAKGRPFLKAGLVLFWLFSLLSFIVRLIKAKRFKDLPLLLRAFFHVSLRNKSLQGH